MKKVLGIIIWITAILAIGFATHWNWTRLYTWMIAAPIIFWFTLWYRKRLGREKQKDIHLEIMCNPRYAHYRRTENILIAGYFLSWLLCSGILTFIIISFRKVTLASPDIIFADSRGSIGVVLPLLFLSMILMALPLELLQFRLFPEILTSSQKKRHLRSTWLTIAIAALILILPAYLFYDAYTLVSTTAVVEDRFLSLQAQLYPLSEIERIEITTGVKRDDFFISLQAISGNKRIDLRGDSPNVTEPEWTILNYFKAAGIPLVLLHKPSAEEYARISAMEKTGRGRSGGEAVREFTSTLSEIKRIISIT